MYLVLYYFPIIFGLSAAVTRTFNEVVEYSDNIFDSKMIHHKRAIVMFYADWCEVCKDFKPYFARANLVAKQKNMDVKFIKVNCEHNGKITCVKYDVPHYPFLKYFVKGVAKGAVDNLSYTSDDVKEILQFLKEHDEKRYAYQYGARIYKDSL